MAALRADLSLTRSELKRQQKHHSKEVNDLKKALSWAQHAESILNRSLTQTRLRMKTFLTRSQLERNRREESWARTEASLNEAKESAVLDAIKIREKIRINCRMYEQALAKVQQKRVELAKLLMEKSTDLHTSDVDYQTELQAQTKSLQMAETKLQETQEELSKNRAELKKNLQEMNQNMYLANGTRSLLKSDQSKLHSLNEEVTMLRDYSALVKEDLATEEAKELELKNTVGHLQNDIAKERTSATHFQDSAQTFRMVGSRVNETMLHVVKERAQALLISRDLLKVRLL